MQPAADTALKIGAWQVDPAIHQIARDGEVLKLEARTMRLLLYLAERAGETIDTDELLDRVWAGTVVTQASVYQAVASLRKILGDDAKNPAYIVTVPRRGYRLIAEVVPQVQTHEAPPAPPRPHYWKAGIAVAAAVLPFLDLTSQSMDEEYFQGTSRAGGCHRKIAGCCICG